MMHWGKTEKGTQNIGQCHSARLTPHWPRSQDTIPAVNRLFTADRLVGARSVFTRGIWWIGSTMNRSGPGVQILAMLRDTAG